MSILLVHKRNAIDCYFDDREGVLSVPFPPEAIYDTDIRSEQIYQQTIKKALGNKSTYVVPAILVMADEVCYVAQAKPDEVDAKTKELIVNTPFTHIETTTLQAQNLIYIIATNADLYEAAARTFGSLGYTINLVVPLGALVFYKLVVAGKVDNLAVKRIFDAQSTLKHSGFPLTAYDHVDVFSPMPTTTQQKKKLSVGWIIFIACAVCYAIGMVWFLARR